MIDYLSFNLPKVNWHMVLRHNLRCSCGPALSLKGHNGMIRLCHNMDCIQESRHQRCNCCTYLVVYCRTCRKDLNYLAQNACENYIYSFLAFYPAHIRLQYRYFLFAFESSIIPQLSPMITDHLFDYGQFLWWLCSPPTHIIHFRAIQNQLWVDLSNIDIVAVQGPFILGNS